MRAMSYSGAVAASAFAALEAGRDRVHRVVLLGTAHSPVARPGDHRGRRLRDAAGRRAGRPRGDRPVADLPQVVVDDRAHRVDHALEVELPFLQEVLDRFAIVPFLVGRCSAGGGGRGARPALGGRGDGDRRQLGPEPLPRRGRGPACSIGRRPTRSRRLDPDRLLRGVRLRAAGDRGSARSRPRRHGLEAETLDLRHSGDFGGPADRVVGYGAFVFARDGLRRATVSR